MITMRTRVIVAVTIVIVLGLGIGSYVAAQEDITLPSFTPGQVLTAQELNNILEALEILNDRANRVNGRLTCNTEGACNSDADLSDECKDFVGDCLKVADPEGCIKGGLFICEEEEPPPDLDETNVCTRDECFADTEQAQKCLNFLEPCLLIADSDSDIKGCIGGAYLICLEVEFEIEPF